MIDFLKKNAAKIVAGATLAVTLVYTLVLLVLPATMFVASWWFPVPEGVINPHLAKAVTLTFSFLMAWLITKYMLGWNALNKKIAVFAGIVGVGILYNFTLWWLTTAEPRKKMSELQEQSEAQQATIAQCGAKIIKLRAKVSGIDNAKASCEGRVTQLQQTLAASEKDKQDLVATDVQRVQELTQCRSDTETLRAQYAAFDDERNREWNKQIEALRQQFNESATAAVPPVMREAQSTPVQVASLQPAVYGPDPVPASPLPPAQKKKAHVVVLDAEYEPAETSDDEMVFTIAEKAGVDVVFSSYTISIWRREYLSEALERTKRDKPITFHRETGDWRIAGGTSSSKKEFNLAYYDNWLWLNDWVELEFYGIDANGNPQKVLVAAGRR